VSGKTDGNAESLRHARGADGVLRPVAKWYRKFQNYPIKKPMRKQFNKPFVSETIRSRNRVFSVFHPGETHAPHSSHFNGFMDTFLFYGYLFPLTSVLPMATRAPV
jgi:hypothetical protein